MEKILSSGNISKFHTRVSVDIKVISGRTPNINIHLPPLRSSYGPGYKRFVTTFAFLQVYSPLGTDTMRWKDKG